MSPELVTISTALGLYLAIVVSPGPNFALVSRLALSGQREMAFGSIFGFSACAAMYAILTMTGLALLLDQAAWLARALQIGGGLYLIWLGISAWRSGGQHSAVDAPYRGSAFKGFRTGFLVNMANPKAIAFFVSLYAVAIPPETPLWARIVILFGGFACEVVWYGLVVLTLTRSAPQRFYRRFSRWIERAMGTLLAGFGLKMLTDR